MPKRSNQDSLAEFEQLARLHGAMLEAYLRSLVGNGGGAGGGRGGLSALVDDLFQEVFVVAWRRFNDYDRSRPFDAWLRGIARNLVMEMARKSLLQPATVDPQTLDCVDARYDSFAASLAPGATFSEGVDRLLSCLAALPPAMREVIELAYGRGMMLKEIASALGIEEETVKKRVQRCRGSLAECLRRQEGGA